jgi:tetratricopeptide (TPR) repeat protein
MAKVISSTPYKALLIVVFAMVVPVNAAPTESPTIRILLNRAQTQAQSGHLNIAVSTWQQVLASDPVNVEALRSVAAAEVQLGHQAEANAYIQRLQKTGASVAVIGQLQSMHARPSEAELLEQASALAKSGQYSGAIEIYRKLYGDNPPAGDTALVYYDTLAALPSERKHAIEGLRKLTRQFSVDERYSIALGRVLTYDAPTRIEGIALLRRYPADRNADDALKQALIWSERTPTPQDATAQSSSSSVRVSETPVSSTSELGIGFRALNAGNLSEAGERFHAALAHEATHGQAHAGLGYILMRQQDFGAAVREFEQAKEDGDRDVAVTQALANSRFWNSMSEAKSALDKGDLESAIASYRNALTLKPDSSDAVIALGGTLLRAARPKEAIPLLQRAVRSDSGSQALWRSLFLAQSQGSDRPDAVKTAERIPSNLRALLEGDPEFMGSLAADYAAIGEQSRSDSILKRALALSQSDGEGEESIAKQLQYGSLLLTARRYSTAVRTYRRVLTAAPNNPDAWRGFITAAHLTGQDDEALRAFREMPSTLSVVMLKDINFLSMLAGIYQSEGKIEAARATLMRGLKIASSAALQLQLASLEMSDGDKQYATGLYARIAEEHSDSTEAWLGWIQGLHATGHDRDALRQIDEMPENVNGNLMQNPEYLQTTALIYGALGNKRRATEAMAQVDDLYAQQGIDPPAAVQLQRGWLLLQSGDTSQLSRVIQELSRLDDLTDEQQIQIAHLWASWAVQRASLLTQQGNRTAAVAVLAVALKAFPEDVSLNNALANAYLANGEAKRSVALYAREDMNRAEAAVCVAAVNAALVANDGKQAQAWLQISLDRFENDAKVLELAARFEEQRGDRRRAAAYDRAALEAAGPPSIAELTASSTGATLRGAGPSARQELFNLIAPGPEPRSDIRSRTPDDLSQDGNALPSPHSKANREKDIRSRVTSDKTDYDLARAPIDPDTPRRQKRNSSVLASEASRDAYDDDWLSPAIGNARTPSVTASSSRGHQGISNKTSASVITAAPVDDLPGGDVTYLAKATISNSYSRHSSPEGHSNSSAGDLPTYEAQVLSVAPDNQPSSAESSGVIYRNAALNRVLSHSEVEMISTSDAPASVAMLAPLSSEPMEPLPPLSGLSRVVKQPLTARQQTEQNLADIESSSSSYFGGNSSIGFHSGQPGFDRLTNFSADAEQSTMFGNGARATVVVHPTLLQSGTADATATFQMGTLPLGALSGIQTAAGVGGELQLRTRSFGASLGYTPRGFLVENVTGRLLIQPGNGPVTLSFERQPIEDTQLSYSGLRDLGSTTLSNPGNIWGGVIGNAGSLLISHSDAVSGWYVQGGGELITGEHVESNYRIDGYAGAYWSIWNHPEYGKLTLGMNLFGMHYANNQRLFTYGNGGYFSPGAYLLSSVPVTFDGTYNSRFHYKASGSLGLQAFQEDASPYFPIDSALQAAAKNPFTAERISVGANYSVEAEGSYLITDHWHVGGYFSLNNSYDYTSDRLGFFLRYAFYPQSTDAPSGPTGLESNRGLRPLFTR